MTPKEIAEKSTDAFNRRDAKAFAALYSDDAVAHDPQYAVPLKGRAALAKDAEDFFLAFPDVTATIGSVVASGDSAAIEMEVNGTHRGPLLTPDGPIPATNRRITMRIGRFVRINKTGAITEDNRYYDMAALGQQLGISS